MIQPAGGTEILFDQLTKRVDLSQINLIVSVCHPDLLSDSKPNVLWQHLSYDQENVAMLQDINFVKKLDAIVFVSHWQHEQFRKRFPLDDTQCYVIQNAVEEFPQFIEKPEKLKLIYTSTPWRGLHVLIEVLKRLNRDVDVEVYSGTSIYGSAFKSQIGDRFEHLYRTLNQLGAKHIEYAPNSEVRKAVQTAHILAYPSVFEETSCLSAIEALAAGCKVVTTNYGALYETCGVWADYVPVSSNLIERYTEALQHNIDNYWADLNIRQMQQVYYNTFWTWNYRKIEQWEHVISERVY
jgi:glycosyltransferase involved in cell wall biosynthesis